jgi:hypothetical protein
MEEPPSFRKERNGNNEWLGLKSGTPAALERPVTRNSSQGGETVQSASDSVLFNFSVRCGHFILLQCEIQKFVNVAV